MQAESPPDNGPVQIFDLCNGDGPVRYSMAVLQVWKSTTVKLTVCKISGITELPVFEMDPHPDKITTPSCSASGLGRPIAVTSLFNFKGVFNFSKAMSYGLTPL